VLQAHADYLDAAYDEVTRVYGSFDRYLRDGLGLSEPQLRDLRTHLLE
jgi:protein-tyrosine phosphatase